MLPINQIYRQGVATRTVDVATRVFVHLILKKEKLNRQGLATRTMDVLLYFLVTTFNNQSFQMEKTANTTHEQVKLHLSTKHSKIVQ